MVVSMFLYGFISRTINNIVACSDSNCLNVAVDFKIIVCFPIMVTLAPQIPPIEHFANKPL